MTEQQNKIKTDLEEKKRSDYNNMSSLDLDRRRKTPIKI